MGKTENRATTARDWTCFLLLFSGSIAISGCNMASSFSKIDSGAQEQRDRDAGGGASSDGESPGSSGSGRTPGSGGPGTIPGSGGSPGSGNEIPAAKPIVSVGTTLRNFRPALAVRGLQCMMCHADLESNVITDFGYGSRNFHSVPGSAPTFFAEDTAYGNHRASWQSARISGGSIIVPAVQLSAAEALRVFGMNRATTLSQALQAPGLGGTSQPMATVPVIERKQVLISYPIESELLSLIPEQARGAPVSVGPALSTQSEVQGLALDESGSFVRNSGGDGSKVVCNGDIVVRGPLFLNNLRLQSGSKGCRLYVAGSVFIQGAITYVDGEAGGTLQISSSRAILMGFNLRRLGASGDPASIRVSSHIAADLGGTPGGPFVRFGKSLDASYDPAGDPAKREAYFDSIVSDARKIGSLLVDAADWMSVASPPAGMRVENSRLAFDYQRILLNAPHIHSRYGGSIKGVLIAEIALFLLDDRSSTGYNAHFIYDPAFDSAEILPALPRGILSVSQD